MKTYQYIGSEPTMVRLMQGSEKVKVSPGEIVTSNNEKTYMLLNYFKVFDIEVVEDTTEVKPKKSKK